MRPLVSPGRQWRVPAVLPVAKAGGAVVLVAVGLLFADGDVVQLVLAVLAAAILLGWATRDVLAPVRLAADPEGITVVRGFAGRRHLPWSAVEAVTVDRRARRGLAGEVLEIDAGDSLYLFGRIDLGADPVEVAEALHAIRPD
ncbi:PH domain-containing protein [Micromonospora endolithica]|uniref:PH domain-containing protein n=1 Tax=Micromonospora endolithica TaxID=230091 RepID=A0A3A9ZER5_9ACTN|nr:PH domain-containing protein [Micromonospora endolithica]RKN46214.1 PH domain-containing protein [Micromonospora endolithica]TWJ25068.1 PH (Pleckstrin Homology) domain-containing protein [Micromonospora endolithica]